MLNPTSTTYVGKDQGGVDRIGQVGQKLNVLEAVVGELHGDIGVLADRLASVLYSGPESGNKNPGAPRAAECGLAERLQSYIDAIEDAKKKIQRLVAQVEL